MINKIHFCVMSTVDNSYILVSFVSVWLSVTILRYHIIKMKNCTKVIIYIIVHKMLIQTNSMTCAQAFGTFVFDHQEQNYYPAPVI